MNKRAYETIDELNRAISNNEERIMEINKYIRLAKANYDADSFVNLKDIKREYKQMNRRLRQNKKSLMKRMTNYAEEIDKNTKPTQSNIPLTKQYLQSNYCVVNTFRDVSLNSINDELPIKISSKTLNKIILDLFPNVESRKITGDIKYNLERR